MNSAFLIHVAEPRLMNKTPALRTVFDTNYSKRWAFPGGSVVKNPPAKQETWVQSLGQEYSLKKEMATHSSILAREMQ